MKRYRHKYTAEELLATHQERVIAARRRSWAAPRLSEEEADVLSMEIYGEVEFRHCPTPLERLKLMGGGRG